MQPPPMRVRDHVLLSSLGAVLSIPWLDRRVVGLWAGGVLIDADHYLWFCLRQRRCSPVAAVRFFNQAAPPQDSGTRALHTPVALLGALVLGARTRRLRPVAVGMALHVALDAHHELRMDRARAATLERDEFACRGCGVQAASLGTHLWHQPWLLPDYSPRNLVALCGRCHDSAHTRPAECNAWN